MPRGIPASGKRASGGGRKAVGEEPAVYRIVLPADLREWAREVGPDEIRRILAEAKESQNSRES